MAVKFDPNSFEALGAAEYARRKRQRLAVGEYTPAGSQAQNAGAGAPGRISIPTPTGRRVDFIDPPPLTGVPPILGAGGVDDVPSSFAGEGDTPTFTSTDRPPFIVGRPLKEKLGRLAAEGDTPTFTSTDRPPLIKTIADVPPILGGEDPGITDADHGLGALIDALKKLGLPDEFLANLTGAAGEVAGLRTDIGSAGGDMTALGTQIGLAGQDIGILNKDIGRLSLDRLLGRMGPTGYEEPGQIDVAGAGIEGLGLDISGLNLDALGTDIIGRRGEVADLSTDLGDLGFGRGFIDQLGDVGGEAKGIEDALARIGDFTAPEGITRFQDLIDEIELRLGPGGAIEGFDTPQGFTDFEGKLSAAEELLGGFSGQIDDLDLQPFLGGLEKGQGILEKITGGSFRGQATGGGLLGRALGQTGQLGEELGGIQLPDIKALLADAQGLGEALPLLQGLLGDVGEAADPITQLLSLLSGEGGGIDASQIQRILDEVGINIPGGPDEGAIRDVFRDVLKEPGVFPPVLPDDVGRDEFRNKVLGGLGPGGPLSGDLQTILALLGPEGNILQGIEGLSGLPKQVVDLATDVSRLPTDFQLPDDFERRIAKIFEDRGEEDPGLPPHDFTEILEAIEGIGGAASPLGTDKLLQDLFASITGRVQADPLDAAALRADPVNASLLADLQAQGGDRREALMEKLNRLGVLRSGDTAEVLGKLEGELARGELDILSAGSERARADRAEATSQGISGAGTATGRELGLGEALGIIGGRQTIGGRQADLDTIGAALAALDPDLTKGSNVDFRKLAGAILGGIQGPGGVGRGGDFASIINDALGLAPGGGGGGIGSGAGNDQGGLNTSVVEGEVTGPDPDVNAALESFLRDNPDITTGRYFVKDGKLYSASGGLVATWDVETRSWKRR